MKISVLIVCRYFATDFNSVADATDDLDFPLQQRRNAKNLGFGRAINAAIRQDIRSTDAHTPSAAEQRRPSHTEPHHRPDSDHCPRPLAPARLAAHPMGPGERLLPLFPTSPRPCHGKTVHRIFSLSQSGCCLLVDARPLINEQLFDEDFFMYGEDAELSYRLSLAGWKICCDDRLLALHERSGSSGNGTELYESYTARGHILMASKLDGRPATLLRKLGKAVYLTTRALVRSFRAGQPTPSFR